MGEEADRQDAREDPWRKGFERHEHSHRGNECQCESPTHTLSVAKFCDDQAAQDAGQDHANVFEDHDVAALFYSKPACYLVDP